MPDAHSITLELLCVDLPHAASIADGLRLGLQEKDDVTQDRPIEGADQLTFSFPVTIEPAAFHFKGRAVQGKRGDQFIYLSWGTRDGSTWKMLRRAKIPLTTIPVDLVTRAANENRILKAVIRMTTPKGEPSVASLGTDYVSWSLI